MFLHRQLIKSSSQTPRPPAMAAISVSLLLAIIFFGILSNPPPFSLAQQQRSPSFTSFTISDSPWLPSQNRTIASPNSTFAAGFFSSSANPNRFTFSVWFNKVPKTADAVVWSANASVSASASLVIDSSGHVVLKDPSGSSLWSTGSNSSQLFLREDGSLIHGGWSSFQSPTDTILPNQTVSEISSPDGTFRFMNSTQLVLVSSSAQYYVAPSKFINLDANGKMNMDNGASFVTSDYGDKRFRKLVLGEDGILKIFSFDSDSNGWIVVWQAISELCTVKGTCGPYAICMPPDGANNSTSCVCPAGFRPSTSRGAKAGCTRKENLTSKTKFLRLDYVNYSSGVEGTVQQATTNFSLCQSKCLANKKCIGFGFKYDGTGYCVTVEQLLYGYWSPGTETAMFLRVDQSETDRSNFTGMTKLLETTCPVRISLPLPPKETNTTTRNIVIICTLFAAELISGVLFFWAFLKRYIKYRDMAQTLGLEFLPAGGPKRFTYAELKAATKDFSNLIGRGGFGDVYKGELPDHRVVAVKCLKNVAGGDAEFWAEVTIIARMHHLNLVRLWGFCAEKGQRILVYEYVPNGSLDKFLFRAGRVAHVETDTDEQTDSNQKPILDWNVRYRIALGVARSVAYLHEECLEWVLHCDIKPENILLGDDFCPKISDFGLAKLRKKEDMVSMSRIRGTRGYLAPEWIKADTITSKADVYSFGMVLLEIVSGVRNFETQGSIMESEDWYFPRWAFDKAFKEMKVEDILDNHIKHCYDTRAHFDMVNRMVKTAMWCLQDRPEIRPTMGKVAKMLEGTVDITEPQKPTIFYLGEE